MKTHENQVKNQSEKYLKKQDNSLNNLGKKFYSINFDPPQKYEQNQSQIDNQKLNLQSQQNSSKALKKIQKDQNIYVATNNKIESNSYKNDQINNNNGSINNNNLLRIKQQSLFITKSLPSNLQAKKRHSSQTGGDNFKQSSNLYFKEDVYSYNNSQTHTTTENNANQTEYQSDQIIESNLQVNNQKQNKNYKQPTKKNNKNDHQIEDNQNKIKFRSPIKGDKQKIDNNYVTESEFRDPPQVLNFNWQQYLEVLSYHLLFYAIGPLICIPIKIFNKKEERCIQKNLGLSFNQAFSYVELFILLIDYALIYFIATNPEMPLVFYQQAMQIFFYQFCRILIICTAYGVIHPDKFQLYKKRNISTYLAKQELLMISWFQQSDQIIEEELQNSIFRQEIETTSFYMKFITKPSQRAFKPLRNEKAPKGRISDFIQEDTNFKDLAYGPNLARELIKSAKTVFKQNLFLYAFMLGILRIILNISLNITFEDLKFGYKGAIIFAVSQLIQFFFISAILAQCFMANRELQRTGFFMDQLSFLISAKKIELYEYKKLYPTLNLVCDLSIRSWFKLRQIMLEYGHKYMLRFEMMISAMMVLELIIQLMIAATLFGFKLLELEIFKEGINVKIMSWEALLWIIFLFYIMYQGAYINFSTKNHKLQLMKNLTIIDSIATNSSLLLAEQNDFNQLNSNDGEEEENLNLVNNIRNPTSLHQCDNFMYKSLTEHFLKLKKNNSVQEITQYCRRIVNTLESGIECIEYYERYAPFQLLGFTLNNQILFKLLLILAAASVIVIFNIYQQ